MEISIFEEWYVGSKRPYRPRKALWKFVFNTQHLFWVTKIFKHVQCFATKKTVYLLSIPFHYSQTFTFFKIVFE
jgi:hypothetical protein